MTRILTAADVHTLAFSERLPLLMQFRRASWHPAASPQQRMMFRLAARYIIGNVDSAAYDLMARLQILEGVSGIVSLKPMVAGPWSKNLRMGVKAAQDHFAGTDINPEWFSLQNTGLISQVRGMVRQTINKWTRGREVHFDADDILHNGLMGLTKDGEGQLSQGPLMMQFGHANPGIKKAIPEGKISPSDIAGIIGKFFVQKVADQFQMIDRNKAPAEDALGRSVLDQQSEPDGDAFAFLADALSDLHSPVRTWIYQKLKQQIGEGKWAEMAMAFLTAMANGEVVNKGAMAQQYGMAGGTFSKVLRTKVYPALEALKGDAQLQEKLTDYAERMQRRASSRQRP